MWNNGQYCRGLPNGIIKRRTHGGGDGGNDGGEVE